MVADDDEKVRRGSGVGGLGSGQVKRRGVGSWVEAVAAKWGQSLCCLASRQVGRQAGKGS